VHLTDKLNVTGGARYTMDKKAAVLYGATLTMPAGTRPGQVGVTPLLLGTREAALANPPATRTLKNKKSNYMVSVDYSPVQHVMVYVSTATGYRAGGTGVDRFTEVTAATVNTIRNNPNYYLTTFFLPESITNYEAGLKAQFLENHVTLNAAAFRQKYGNYQYSGIDPVTQTRTTNNADATIRGVELEIILRLGTGTTISGDYGITDAKAKGAGFLAVGAPVAGRSLPGIPKLMYGVSVDQKFELGEAILDLVANYSWRDDYNQYFVVATDIGSRVESVGLLNLSATYVREPWTAAIFANNVTNEKYFTSITYSNPVLSSATLGISRIFGGRLRYSF
jgi:iron complex outermembrane receptor protein